MWTQMQKLLHASAKEAANDSLPFTSPVKKSGVDLSQLAVGKAIRFASFCPLPPLSGATAYVLALRYYRFGTDVIKSYQLQIGRAKHYFLAVAEDEQGQYLGLSRALSEAEQDQWFGRDALGFFMEPSTAKTIRCKVEMATEGAWAGERYSKTVDWVEGEITLANSRKPRGFHYNLLVTESGEKALEVEHDDISGENRVFVTVYRPVEDIQGIESVADVGSVAPPEPRPALSVRNVAPVETVRRDVPLFQDKPEDDATAKPKPDFRRKEEVPAEEIRISRTAIAGDFEAADAAKLPSFLVSKENNYLSLDEVIPPEAERVRVGLDTARMLIERAQAKKVRVRDVLRDMVGLDSPVADEVIFEMPLSDADYRALAMRYRLRPDHRDEIRARLASELKEKLL